MPPSPVVGLQREDDIFYRCLERERPDDTGERTKDEFLADDLPRW